METRLRDLFGLQFFLRDEALQALIDDTERRYAEDISEEELGLLAAAGDPSALMRLPNAGEPDR